MLSLCIPEIGDVPHEMSQVRRLTALSWGGDYKRLEKYRTSVDAGLHGFETLSIDQAML